MAKTLLDLLPNMLEIPVPIPDPRPRGIRSLGALSHSFSIRLDSLMMKRLDKQAEQLGISRGAYVRWCAEKMVEAIDRQVEAKSTQLENTQNDDEPERQHELKLVYPDDNTVPPTPDTRKRGSEGD